MLGRERRRAGEFWVLDTMNREPMAHFDSICLSEGNLSKKTQFADLAPVGISPETSQASTSQ